MMSDAQAAQPATPAPAVQPGSTGQGGQIRRLDGSPIRVLVVDD
jgi:hypothetical protein